MHAVEKMMFTGKKPWWYGNSAQGNAVGVDLGEGAVTSAEAIAAAGLDWEVAKTPAYYKVANDYQEADNEKFLIRTAIILYLVAILMLMNSFRIAKLLLSLIT